MATAITGLPKKDIACTSRFVSSAGSPEVRTTAVAMVFRKISTIGSSSGSTDRPRDGRTFWRSSTASSNWR